MNTVRTSTVFAGPSANDGVAGNGDRFNALGIPVDNLDMEQAVEQIIDMVYRFPRDRRARYVATVNVDFLVNALGVAGQGARHPELLEILRSADLVTADGFPVVKLSQMMGMPLKARVTGADLVPALAERAAKEGLRIYLFGGREEIAHQAASILEANNPGLEIAGVESPMVHTQGEGLMSFEEDDERIIDDINNSGADILFIGLGNPKQEQWFRRHRDRLKVPVSLGIGGTFEFIAGSVRRAPNWVQRSNLEWVYRITQDPKRLWKRYAEGLIKLGLLVSPLMAMRGKELLQGRFTFGRASEQSLGWTQFSGPHKASAASVALPKVLRRDTLKQLLNDIRDEPRRDTLFLLDFSATRRVDINAMQALFELGRYAAAGRAQVIYVGMQRKLRRQLATWRILDLFDGEHVTAEDFHEPLATRQHDADLPIRFYATDSALVVYLHGDIDGELLRRGGLESVLSLVGENQNCVIDLRFARLVESSAVASLHRLAAHGGDGRVVLGGVHRSVRRMFELANVPTPLRIISEAEQRRLMVAA